jgi:hypothetical protein
MERFPVSCNRLRRSFHEFRHGIGQVEVGDRATIRSIKCSTSVESRRLAQVPLENRAHHSPRPGYPLFFKVLRVSVPELWITY